MVLTHSTHHGVVGSALFDMPRRWLLVLTVAAAAAGAVAAYSFTAAKHYKATAVLVVAPVSPADPTFIGIDVLRDTERRSAAATAARLIRTPEIAQTVRLRLGLRSSSGNVLDDISTHVVDTSDAVAVTATTTDRARAAQLANAFVDAFLAARTSTFQSEVVSAVARLQQRLTSIPPNQRLSPTGARLQRRLADTRALVATRDPTVSAGSQATQPTSADWPKPVRWTIFAALAGLALGVLLALLVGLVNAVRRREPLRRTEYDQGVSERIIGRLERRLTERIEALAAEQKRLASRESALEVREREVAAKLKELRAARDAGAIPAPEGDELGAREEALERRVRAVEQREQDLARQAAELARERSEVAEERAALSQGEQAVVEPEETVVRAEVDERERLVGEREASLEERERELETRAAERAMHEEEEVARTRAEAVRRTEELEARDAELAVRATELAAREAELEARQEALARETAELTAGAAAVDAQAIELSAREARLSETQESAARREEELAAREADLAVAEHPLFAPRATAAPPPPIEPIVSPVPPTQGLAAGWRLDELERLVDAQADSFPHRIDEWRSYLYYLRDYADASGRVPDQFDWLIEDTFSELLARR